NGIAVLIQAQVDAALAGVLFTQAPAAMDGHGHNEKGEQMAAEFCYGQGEQLVSGRVNPGRLRISRKNFHWQQLAHPEQAEQSTPEGEQSVCEQWIRQLAEAGLLLEEVFQAAQDIEWVLDRKKQLHIVQARPITVPAPVTATATEKNAEIKYIWSNANVQENFPEPVCPLLYSIASTGYTHYFRKLGIGFGLSKRRIHKMRRPLQNIIGVHGGRIYYNLSNIHTVIREMPFGEHLVDFFNNFVGAEKKTAAESQERKGTGTIIALIRQSLELAIICLKTAAKLLRIEQGVRRFEARADRFAAQTRPNQLHRKSIGQLGDDLADFIAIRQHRWFGASLADFAAMISYGLLRVLLHKAFAHLPQDSLHNDLLKGITGLVSSEPVIQLWKLAEQIRSNPKLEELFQKDTKNILTDMHQAGEQQDQADRPLHRFAKNFDRYLDLWGFRCSGELMLTVPSFQEDPSGLIEILKTYAGMTGDSPLKVLEQQQETRRQLTKELIRRLKDPDDAASSPWPGYIFLLQRCLSLTQTAISLRERARYKQALLYSRVRRIALALGEQLAARRITERKDDLFFLSYQEIIDLVSSREMFACNGLKKIISMRRQEHACFAAMSPPDHFELTEGEYLHLAPKKEDRLTGPQEEHRPMTGITACGGSITGRAAVLKDINESELLGEGDILITRQTDPGWAHIFFLIKGLIIERGGMLSHGAILAREFGIPAVVGVEQVTDRIPQHSTVHLDGDRGYVQIIAE
ncbi:MAG: hypothetical protein D3924_07170, partial [Candidatus Electrothrix sp. AR4]|nr:hypothetical protein [Candidatus Electrothrix sp. AR4]